jgi:predicted O-methyltransferase YrrM
MSAEARQQRTAEAPDLDAALAAIDGVEGWLSEDQARRLWNAALELTGPGQIVEIGSFRGRSTIVLSRAASDEVQIVAIDPHGGGDRGPQEIAPDAIAGEADYQTFHDNLTRAGVDELVRHVRKPSDRALDDLAGPIDVLYVDGAHRYAPARSDIERYGERVVPGGAMLIHDSFNAIGVMLAQLRVLVFSRRWRYAGRSRSLAIYRREPVEGRAWALNALRQLAGLSFFVRNLLIKVALTAHAVPVARALGHGDEPWPY